MSYIHRLVRWFRDTVTNLLNRSAFFLYDWEQPVIVEGRRTSLLSPSPTFYDDTLLDDESDSSFRC